MLQWLRMALIGMTLLLVGCSAGNDLPKPPGVLGIPRGEKVEKNSYTVYVTRIESVDTPEVVGKYYQEQLGSRAGWKSKYTAGSEFGTWTDGNLKAQDSRMDAFGPVDPKKPGNLVLLFPGKDNGSFVILATSEPK